MEKMNKRGIEPERALSVKKTIRCDRFQRKWGESDPDEPYIAQQLRFPGEPPKIGKHRQILADFYLLLFHSSLFTGNFPIFGR
ncbi:MAG: hypothetical protein E7332_09155 [Clostridiales bacterium]|nr:hypothetical protein [Clostridiales bacterium]